MTGTTTQPYCPEHTRPVRNKLEQADHNDLYNHRWRRVRKSYLQDNPLCQDCLSGGIVRPAEDVHHIKKAKLYPELLLEPTNMMALCRPCHNVRTARGE